MLGPVLLFSSALDCARRHRSQSPGRSKSLAQAIRLAGRRSGLFPLGCRGAWKHPSATGGSAASSVDWRDCDAVEAVIGAVADRILAFAKGRGCRTLGHPVCAHPDKVAALVGRAFDDVGLDPLMALPAAGERRRTEIELCDRILVDSGVVAHSFTEAGVPAERISVVPPGADLERFRPRGPDDCDRDVFRVVCVGTITPRKGQHVLLRAWRLLRLPACRTRAGRAARRRRFCRNAGFRGQLRPPRARPQRGAARPPGAGLGLRPSLGRGWLRTGAR